MKKPVALAIAFFALTSTCLAAQDEFDEAHQFVQEWLPQRTEFQKTHVLIPHPCSKPVTVTPCGPNSYEVVGKVHYYVWEDANYTVLPDWFGIEKMKPSKALTVLADFIGRPMTGRDGDVFPVVKEKMDHLMDGVLLK